MSPSAEEESESDRGSLAEEDVPFFGGVQGALGMELLLEPSGEDEDPFPRLDDSGRFSTVLLGQVVLGAGPPLERIAFKLQRTSYRRPEPGPLGTPTNADIDDLWKRKRARLLEERSQEVVALHDVGEGRFRQKPVTFCRETRKYFHPLCPTCRGFLRDCRDDDLLRDSGLPAYSESTARYIYCPRCAGSGGRTTFYAHASHEGERPNEKANLRRKGELYRDMAAILDADLPPPERARLERIFPCLSCAHAAECRGPAKEGDPGGVAAESRLVPLSFYEFHVLPMEALELHFDELCDYLGGMEWSEVRKRASEGGARGRDRLLDAAEDSSTEGRSFVHESDGTGLLAGEVLLLKLIAFKQLCRGVREHHARSRMPHLDLGPRSAMARIRSPGSGLPPRWSFSVKVIDPGAALVFRPAGRPDGAVGEVLVPPLDAPEEYHSPYVRQGVGRDETVRLSLRSIDGGALEAEAASPRSRQWDHQPGDAVRVVPRSGPLEGKTLWGRVSGRTQGGLLLRLESDALPRDIKLPASVEASIAFHRKLDVPCDLYPLGMLFFRALLVNDAQDSYAVGETLGRIISKVKETAFGSRDPERIRGLFDWQLEAEAAGLRPEAVLHPGSLRREPGKPPSRSEDRAPGEAIPRRLWSDVLMLGFRLLTSFPAFSYAAHASDCDPNKPEALLDRVLAELEALIRRVHVDVFGAGERDRAVVRACDALLAEASGGEIVEATVRLSRPLSGRRRQ